MDIHYQDYKIEITPDDTDKLDVVDNTATMAFQVIRTWFYEENDELATASEKQDVTVLKQGDSFILEDCYEKVPNYSFGPIDQVYKDAIKSGENLDEKLTKYMEDFEKAVKANGAEGQ